MAMSQTDKDIHEMVRKLNDICNALRTQNSLLAKLISEPITVQSVDDVKKNEAFEVYSKVLDTARTGVKQ